MDYKAFREQAHTPLHALEPAETFAFAQAMMRWLESDDERIRKQATERLATAVLWEDLPRGMTAEEKGDYWTERLSWLTAGLEAAAEKQPDIVPFFLRDMRYRHPRRQQLPIVRTWLDRLERLGLADPDLVLGTRIAISEDADWEKEASNWVEWLDHPSDWVRGCAAVTLGNLCDDDTVPSEAELFQLIGEKELVRPGVAGPFWSLMQFSPSLDAEESVALWMMDLLERRQGSPPRDMPANDIPFFLHELCCDWPEMVDRMMAGGFEELAAMTATELAKKVEGLKPRLERLVQSANAHVAASARNHLARYYADESGTA